MKINKIPILTYHSINDNKSDVSINIKTFEDQIIYLKKRGYKSINLNETSTSIKKKIVITFDDGYKDIFFNALPILKKYNYTATCFIITNFIGKTNIWDSKKSNYSKKDLMDKSEIKRWVSSGMTIGSHSHNHFDLTNLNLTNLKNELSYSKNLLEDISSKQVNFFSYPYGKANQLVYDNVKKIYSNAVTTNRSRFNKVNHSNCLMPRIDMGNEFSNLKMFLKLETFYEDIKFKDNELYL